MFLFAALDAFTPLKKRITEKRGKNKPFDYKKEVKIIKVKIGKGTSLAGTIPGKLIHGQ
jgi:hypothetical protein